MRQGFQASDAVWLMAGVFGHPFWFLLVYCAAMAVPGFWIVTATNTGRPDPAFLAPGLSAVFGLRYGVWRLGLRRAGKAWPADGFALFARAHKPALWALPVTLFAGVSPLEGNAFGFVALPLLLVLSVVVGLPVRRRIKAAA